MKTAFRCFCALMCAFVLTAFWFPMTASANGPAPSPWYAVYLSNLPEGTAYVDLLIPLEESDPKYCASNFSALPEGFSPDAEILAYCEGGYRSYTFHYADAQSQIVPKMIWQIDMLCVTFFEAELSAPDSYLHLEDVESRKTACLALLDKEGNILKVSEICNLQDGLFSYSLHSFYYDGQSNTLKMETEISALSVVVFLLMSTLGLIVTCMIERLVAWPFGLGEVYGRTILKTNIWSQLAMRIASILLYGWLIKSYYLIVILLEIPVYVGEFLFYRKKMSDVSGNKVLLYVLAANTASLVVGLFVNLMLLNG